MVHPFENLLIDCARDVGAQVIVRGLRAVADFEYEFQMVGMNRALDASVETVFLMADVALQPIASRLVKEIAMYGGSVSPFVSPEIAREVAAGATADHQNMWSSHCFSHSLLLPVLLAALPALPSAQSSLSCAFVIPSRGCMGRTLL